MATGQTLLTLAAIVLLSIITMSIRQMHLQSVTTSIDSQVTNDALNFGRDLAEEIYSYSYRYDELDTRFGGYTDVSDPAKRITFNSQVDIIYHATIELSSEKELQYSQIGRTATIKIYQEEKTGDFKMIAEYVTAIISLSM